MVTRRFRERAMEGLNLSELGCEVRGSYEQAGVLDP
jgi:hypothetical protein